MKKIKIQIPEGYEGIDEEKSSLEKGVIVFKKKEVTPWRKSNPKITGFYVTSFSRIADQPSSVSMFEGGNENLFAAEKQAKSMLAMSQLSQIIQNDPRFGGPITDKEWNQRKIRKYCIVRDSNNICHSLLWGTYYFLAFHTQEQCDLFLEENKDLIRQYYMLD